MINSFLTGIGIAVGLVVVIEVYDFVLGLIEKRRAKKTKKGRRRRKN